MIPLKRAVWVFFCSVTSGFAWSSYTVGRGWRWLWIRRKLKYRASVLSLRHAIVVAEANNWPFWDPDNNHWLAELRGLASVWDE